MPHDSPEEPLIDPLFAGPMEARGRTSAEAPRGGGSYGGAPDLVVSLSRSGRSVRLFTALDDAGYSTPNTGIDRSRLELYQDR